MKLPKYVYRLGAGRHLYFRRDGVHQRMPDDTDSSEFRALYAKLRDGGTPPPPPGSLSALIKHYRKSERFTQRAERTRRDYETILVFLDGKAGHIAAKAFRRKDIVAIRDANRGRTRFANYCVQVAYVLFEHARDLGWREDNPAKGVLLLKTPKSRQQAHEPWPEWACTKFREEARPRERLIFELGIATTQRPDDLTRFKWRDYDGKTLKLSQQKTGEELVIPVTPRLKAILDATQRPKVEPIGGAYILCRKGGGQMSYRYLAQIILVERKRLGCEAYDLHALRYTGIMELAWAGCSDDEIASYSGHRSMAMIRKYAGKARQIMRARQAAEKRG